MLKDEIKRKHIKRSKKTEGILHNRQFKFSIHKISHVLKILTFDCTACNPIKKITKMVAIVHALHGHEERRIFRCSIAAELIGSSRQQRTSKKISKNM